jgi:hypothetical protein
MNSYADLWAGFVARPGRLRQINARRLTSAQTRDQMQSGPLHNVVVRQWASVFKLLARKDLNQQQ